MTTILMQIASVFLGTIIIKSILFWLYFWQAKEYRFDRVLIHLRETKQGKKIIFGWENILKVAAIFLYGVTIFNQEVDNLYPLIVTVLLGVCSLKILWEALNKKIALPVFTYKTIVIFILTAGFTIFLYSFPPVSFFFWILIIDRLIPFFIAILIALFSLPSDFYKDTIINKAVKKIDSRRNLLVIGITGSYGKGSTKEYLYTILSYKFNTLKTFAAYNTPIGIAKTILNGLTDKKQIFIVEMGAYKIGDIAEMCKMVKPRIGILTGINDQHTSLFGGIDNTIKAKYELIESLPNQGMGVFNGNNANVYALFKKTKKNKAVSIVDYDNTFKDEADIKAYDIETRKLHIDFKISYEGKSIGSFKVDLIGRHNIENVLPGIYVGLKLGMTPNEIRNAIKEIKPFTKTMLPRQTAKSLLMVDDTYNANPASVLAAVEYLSIFKKKKMMVLQPMIELGKNAKEDHRMVARSIGKVCDYLVLTNDNYFNEIKKGIEESEGKCKVFVLTPKKTATLIQQKLTNHDVVLFEGKESAFSLSLINSDPIYS